MFQENLLLISNAAQIVCTILSFGIVVAVFKKDSKNWANRLLATGAFFLGMYILFSFLYDVFHVEWVIFYFARLTWILNILCVCFLYFTFKVLVKSSLWLEKKSRTWPFLIGIGVYGFCIFLIPDSVVILNISLSKTQPSIWIMVISAIGILYFVLTSLILLITVGIRHATGDSRKKMLTTTFGLFICLVAIVFGYLGRATEEIYFDILFFCTLTLGVIFIAYGFIRSSKA